jgi:flagellar FliL protein
MFNREKSNNEFKAFDVELNTNLENSNDNKDSIIKNHHKVTILALLVCVFIGGFLFFKSLRSQAVQVQSNDYSNKVMFVPLNEMTINLKNSKDNNTTWLRFKVVLEVKGKNNYDSVSQLTPKIVDIFQTYLKELRQSDLDGSFGIYKIKNEMMMRINTIIYPAAINAILFQEIIVQAT